MTGKYGTRKYIRKAIEGELHVPGYNNNCKEIAKACSYLGGIKGRDHLTRALNAYETPGGYYKVPYNNIGQSDIHYYNYIGKYHQNYELEMWINYAKFLRDKYSR